MIQERENDDNDDDGITMIMSTLCECESVCEFTCVYRFTSVSCVFIS